MFVGASDADAALAAEHGWEYQPVEAAAEAAGWALAEDDPADPNPPEEPTRDDWP